MPPQIKAVVALQEIGGMRVIRRENPHKKIPPRIPGRIFSLSLAGVMDSRYICGMQTFAANILASSDSAMRGAKRLYFILRKEHISCSRTALSSQHKVSLAQIRATFSKYNYSRTTGNRHIAQLVGAGWLRAGRGDTFYIVSTKKIEAAMGTPNHRRLVAIPDEALSCPKLWQDFVAAVTIASLAKSMHRRVTARTRQLHTAEYLPNASGPLCAPLSCSVIRDVVGYASVSSASRLRTRAMRMGVTNERQWLALDKIVGDEAVPLVTTRKEFLAGRAEAMQGQRYSADAVVQKGGRWYVCLPNLVGYGAIEFRSKARVKGNGKKKSSEKTTGRIARPCLRGLAFRAAFTA